MSGGGGGGVSAFNYLSYFNLFLTVTGDLQSERGGGGFDPIDPWLQPELGSKMSAGQDLLWSQVRLLPTSTWTLICARWFQPKCP